jgi:DNA polymerase-3 subunit beta
MEFTVSKADITAGLYKAQGVVDRKSTLNILSHVLIESTTNTEVRFTCTDYDVVLTGTYPAEVSEPGRIAVGARNLYDVVKALPDKPIHIRKLENHWVELRCGSSRFKLAGLPADDFPEQKQPEDMVAFQIPKRLLLDMVDRTLFSVSHDETRPSLNGVSFTVTPEDGVLMMVMVSTDGHRLSKTEARCDVAGEATKAASAILHHKAINELKRSLEGDDEATRVSFHRGNVFFANDEVVLQVRELDETFPDWTKVMPKSNKIVIPMSRTQLAEAVKRIATLTSAKTNIIKVEVLNGKIVLSSQNPEAGEGQDQIETAHEGDELTVGFNYRYVLDVLNVIAGDTVKFSINDQYSPGLFTSDDDDGSKFVIMPMRI